MMEKMNIERLIDITIECMESINDYYHSSKKYYKEHGHGVYLDRLITAEEKHIGYCYHRESADTEKMTAIAEILDLDREAQDRLYSAARAAKKWYEKTKWQYLLKPEMLNQFEQYIFNGKNGR